MENASIKNDVRDILRCLRSSDADRALELIDWCDSNLARRVRLSSALRTYREDKDDREVRILERERSGFPHDA